MAEQIPTTGRESLASAGKSTDATGHAAAHYDLVARAIRILQRDQRLQPTLADLTRRLGTSEAHLQRVFSAWAGVSPKRFLQSLTRDAAVAALRDSATVLEAALEAGLSGPGRLHDLTVACDALTPGEIAAGGARLTLRYGWAETPFGAALLGFGERGIYHLGFHDAVESTPVEALAQAWPAAGLVEDRAGARALAGRIFAAPLERGRLNIVLRGTNFQLRVWRALLAIRPGQRASYAQLARLAGRPGANRAVGSALARNHIAYLIPCHRVIRGDGSSGEYRWGTERKLALQGWESAQRASA
jgi:AraC family transcriptional regulator, regulatory protein of adaptative response / methylated-DNA-[protein]-cysteine methyltransferase